VHKFTSCDGCQLAFLNAGESFLTLHEIVDIVHFAEAGKLDPDAKVDIAFIEGSVSTSHEVERVQKIRANSKNVVTIGACATAGGVQALRNMADHADWMAAVYATPQIVSSLATSTAIAKHIKVDLELWGCPVNTRQVMEAIRFLCFGALPAIKRDSVCMECKRAGNVCVLVTQKQPCMGPVTQTGCGALCPSVGRACYGCYGPAENMNAHSLGKWFEGFGIPPKTIANQFLHINNQAKEFLEAGQKFAQEP
jgi:coenzyme F420-reducing hydrogenase gamma subunit